MEDFLKFFKKNFKSLIFKVLDFCDNKKVVQKDNRSDNKVAQNKTLA